MPQFIKKAPWYATQQGEPSLKHQRARTEKGKVPLDTWYNRGAKSKMVVTKFRKGACDNCGAMTHIKKFCTERPRKMGAKYTSKDIKPDENI